MRYKSTTVASNHVNVAMRWSDIAAGRKSTHPDAAPIKRILATTELLEQVLMHLPMRDLLRAKQLCHTVHNLITTSPEIQIKLYLRAADPNKSGSWVVDTNTKALLSDKKAKEYIAKAEKAGVKVKVVHPVIANPLVTTDRDENYSSVYYFLNDISAGFYVWPCMIIPRYLTYTSYMDMFLTQPPAKSIRMHMNGYTRYEDDWDRAGLPKSYWGPVGSFCISNPNDLTVRDVMEGAKYQGKEIDRVVFMDVAVFDSKVHDFLDRHESVGPGDKLVEVAAQPFVEARPWSVADEGVGL